MDTVQDRPELNPDNVPLPAFLDSAAVLAEAVKETVDERPAVAEKAAENTFQTGKYDSSDATSAMYVAISRGKDGVPEYGTPARDVYTSTVWHQEPIMAGAVYAMVSMVGAWNYTLTGTESWTAYYNEMLNRADDGKGWTHFIQRFAVDLLTLDRGAFAEVARAGDGFGRAVDIYNIDGLRCRTVNNSDYPIVWRGNDGKWYKIPAQHVVHQVSLPSARDADRNIGFCPVSRALKASQVLLLLHEYDSQKLANLPPEGVATVTGISMKNLQQYFAMYQANRMAKNQSVFSGVLWITGGVSSGMAGNPGLDLKLTAFSELPESFDRALTVEIYAKTLALCFGVDVGEFWLIQHAGATKASQTVQHQKAKGKGPGDLATGIERWMNWNVLGDSVEFVFDMSDDESDLMRTEVHEKVVANVAAMVNMGAIDGLQAATILAQAGVLPAEFAEQGTERVLDDIEKSIRQYAWEQGEDLVRVDRHGKLRYKWRAAKQFAPGTYLPAETNTGFYTGKVGREEADGRAIINFAELPADSPVLTAALEQVAKGNGARAQKVLDVVDDVPAETVEQPAGGLAEEVATLPAWRRGDLDDWERGMGGAATEFLNTVDDRLEAWLAEDAVEVEPDVEL